MSQTDPPSVTGMRLVERSAKSLSLSWSVSRRANPSTIRYKLMYCEKVRSPVDFIIVQILDIDNQ